MFRLIASALAVTALALPASAWGKTGHRIVGEVATTYLSEPAATAIEACIYKSWLPENALVPFMSFRQNSPAAQRCPLTL